MRPARRRLPADTDPNPAGGGPHPVRRGRRWEHNHRLPADGGLNPVGGHSYPVDRHRPQRRGPRGRRIRLLSEAPSGRSLRSARPKRRRRPTSAASSRSVGASVTGSVTASGRVLRTPLRTPLRVRLRSASRLPLRVRLRPVARPRLSPCWLGPGAVRLFGVAGLRVLWRLRIRLVGCVVHALSSNAVARRSPSNGAESEVCRGASGQL
jgi:hypothetical protein